MNIVLTGFMASGKSTVGKRLSQVLNRRFVDTDAIIENTEKMTISKIFEKHGEAYFRDLEKNTVLEISKEDNLVIATGGGAVLHSQNIENLRKNGIIINLSPEEEVIKLRLLGDSTRPLAACSDFLEIMERFQRRKPFYDNCDYQIKISMDMSVDEICGMIEDFLRGRI